MLKLMTMVSLAFLWSKVESSAEELELMCPRGWIAFDVVKYTCGYLSISHNGWVYLEGDCLLCLTCQRSSGSANALEKMELCLITSPLVAFNMDLMKPHQFQAQNWNFPEITELIQQKQLCGISALYSQKLDKVVTKACDQQQKDKGSETTDLICPRSFFLVSRFKVKNADQEKSLCIHCQSYKTFNIVPARIFMCYPSITRKMAINKFHPSLMEDCKNTPTTFQVGTQIFCGMKIRPLDYENFSECVLCQSEKAQHRAESGEGSGECEGKMVNSPTPTEKPNELSSNGTVVKIQDCHENDRILYACLAVTTILAIAFSIALIRLILSYRKLRNELVDVKKALGIDRSSPRSQGFDEDSMQAHYQNTEPEVFFSPNYYYGGNGDDQNRIMVQ